MNLSFWEKQELYNPRQIAIIGGGIVGLTTAIYLKRRAPEIPVTIFERGGMPLGASTKNAGFACFGSISEILDDLSSMKESEVVSLIRNRYEGLQRIFSIVRKEDIEYKDSGGYEIFTDDHQKSYNHCIEHIEYCNEIVKKATGLNSTYSLVDGDHTMKVNLPMIFNPYEGQLNPYKMVKSLITAAYIAGVNFVFDCNVNSIDFEERKITCNGTESLPYDQLVICTNGFAKALLKDLEVFPARNQVLMTGECRIPFTEGCYHYNKGYVYFRNYKGRILLGGGRNLDMEGEQTAEFGTTSNIKEHLLSFLYNVLQVDSNVKVDHWWSGILGVGNTKETIIKEYLPGHYIGVRLGGMGVALGSQVGHKLANMIVI